ncbi:flagellar biosynthetic protein FliP [Nocardioides mangrovicus]|uniref:Flagellar biosynthetic protein FliP n=1 Tax=Nocardioides mangrovicus TaxID=2478913 RepID=A0A3L8P330_9ACTN|nr:flagellar type III secretion system pore protein FliP [Nocardioides mangrovicus]RLV49387.1 flagellar biosynthetic protein FliP [Nocardioides mangrovicus]
MTHVRRAATLVALLFSGLVIGFGLFAGAASAASATSATSSVSAGAAAGVGAPSLVRAPSDPVGPTGPTAPSGSSGSTSSTDSTDSTGTSSADSTDSSDANSVDVNLKGITGKPSTGVSVIVAMTLLSLLPAIVLTCTSFTKILVVLGLTRNALGLQQTPPNQVLAGLALFLSLFIMAPVLHGINEKGVQPYLDGTKTSAQAWHDGSEPLKKFMLHNTQDDQIELLSNVAKRPVPKDREDVSMATLVPAFVLSELKQAFIIGFIIFIPFLVIDLVVSGALMALGMMMMPPVMVSLPFKLLLFVMVDGWALIIKALVASYGGG